MFLRIIHSLSDLEVFIKKASAGLACTVEEGDYDSLVGVMMHLLAVKDRQGTTDNMFEPLKQTIELLKSYDQELSDDVHQQLQELPEQWNAVKKQSMVVKQDVAPLQTTEANNIRRKANTFDVSAQPVGVPLQPLAFACALYASDWGLHSREACIAWGDGW